MDILHLYTISVAVVMCCLGTGGSDTVQRSRVTRVRRQTEVLEDFCLHKKDGQIYPDPSNCRSYVFCSGGFGYRSTCASNLYYNPEVQTCDFTDGHCRGNNNEDSLNNVRSKLSVPWKNPSFPVGEDPLGPGAPPTRNPHLPVGVDPDAHSGIPLAPDLDAPPPKRHSLPMGLKPKIVSPTPNEHNDQEHPTLPTVAELIRKDKARLEKVQADIEGELGNICLDKADGTHPHPDDCHSYVYCSNSLAFPAVCPDQLIYNHELGGCDFDISGQCHSARELDTEASSRPTQPQTSVTRPADSTLPDSFNDLPVAVSEQLARLMPEAIQRAMTMLTESLQDEADEAKHQTELSGRAEDAGSHKSTRPFKLVQQFLKAKPIAKQLSMVSFILNSASEELMEELGMTAETLADMASPLPPNPNRIQKDEVIPLPEPGTCPWPMYNCRIDKYRSHDGSCNNLHQPIRGRSFTPLKRYLPQSYDDGMHELRLAVGGGQLPDARKISYTVAEDRDLPHHIHTVMLMQWGQFVDHDLTLTAISKICKDPSGYGTTADIECGDDGCATDNEACVPIVIREDDPHFSGKKCLEFVRSQGVPNLNCTMGPREQLNQITSYLDASNIYGSTKAEADPLRDLDNKDRGMLRFSPHPLASHLKYLLPQTSEDKECKQTDTKHQCFKAGDERVNEQNALTVMHTIWLREHNRIEEELHRINPDWSGDTLYQETRRIVGAMLQHITYNEFLPTLLGPDQVRIRGLELITGGYYGGYNSSTDASIANVFAAAAYRVGHTLIPDRITRADSSYNKTAYPSLRLNEIFFRPREVYNTEAGGLDSFLRGLCDQHAQSYDRFVTKEVTQQLFSEKPPGGLGTDLVSLNIMRARDHGIPGYNAWREWCGLRRARDFTDFADTMDEANIDNLQNLYSHVDDVDLFPAGISERAVRGGLIGTTFACIIGRQFRDLRSGDRYWYENNGASRFTPDQLEEIRKITLAKVICTNSDAIDQIQPSVMELPFREAYPDNIYSEFHEKNGLNERWFSHLWTTQYNQRVNCSCLPQINLSTWKQS